jgi:hypothetical protein
VVRLTVVIGTVVVVVVVVVGGTVVVVVVGGTVVVVDVVVVVVVVVGGTVVVVVVGGTVVVVVVGGTVVVVVVVGGTVVVVVVGGTVVVVVVVGGTVVVVVVVVVVGGTVSKSINSAELAVFTLLAASVNTPAPTEIDAVPDELTVGVNVAVYAVPEPLKPEIVPPETVTSLSMKFVEGSDNVNVSASVAPTPRDPEPLRAIETVGGVVSARVS